MWFYGIYFMEWTDMTVSVNVMNEGLGPLKKNGLIGVTRPTLFILPTLYIFY